MALKTLVKVGNITNLSDARYCSGMGVAMLGFTVVENMPNFIDAKAFQEIKGWISGPLCVAEVYGLQQGMVSSIVENYAPDFFELAVEDLPQLPKALAIPLIVTLGTNGVIDFESIKAWKHTISYLVVDLTNTPTDLIQVLSHDYTILLKGGGSATNTLERLQKLPFSGITLDGGTEIKPGLKDYEHLSAVLELLEEAD